MSEKEKTFFTKNGNFVRFAKLRGKKLRLLRKMGELSSKFWGEFLSIVKNDRKRGKVLDIFALS